MTDQECIKHLEFYIDHLDNRIVQLSGQSGTYVELEATKTNYAIARAALITLRNEVKPRLAAPGGEDE